MLFFYCKKNFRACVDYQHISNNVDILQQHIQNSKRRTYRNSLWVAVESISKGVNRVLLLDKMCALAHGYCI